MPDDAFGFRGSAIVTVVSLLEDRALAWPSRTCFGLPDGMKLTYTEWQQRATTAAGGLSRMIERGDRVALMFSLAEWLDYVVAYMAVIMAGGICVPLPVDSTSDDVRRLLQATDAHVSISCSSGEATAALHTTLDELACTTQPLIRPRLAPSETAEILFTSGTTGAPKPVAVTHANLIHHVSTRNTGPRSRAPICHAAAFASNAAQTMLIEPLGVGGRAVITAPSLDDATLAAAIGSFGVTELVASPALLLRLSDSRSYDFSTIRRVNSIAAPITPSALHRIARGFPEATIVNVYTSTEAWPARTTLHLGDGPTGSVGRPRGGSEVAILDADGTRLEPGQIGDVALSLPRGAPPRLRLDARESAGDLVRTGDTGLVDADGYLYILDRESDVINVGGTKIYSLEVERAIASLPDVSDAAVVGLPHQTLGEYVVAAVVLEDPTRIHELRERMRVELGPRKTPQNIVALPVLPRTAGNKVDKRALRDIVAQQSGSGLQSDAGTSVDLLERVTAAWEQGLALADVDGDDNFFACGGDSLLAMQMIRQLSDELGVELPASVYFDWTTAAEMAHVIKLALRERSRDDR